MSLDLALSSFERSLSDLFSGLAHFLERRKVEDERFRFDAWSELRDGLLRLSNPAQ